MASTTWFLIQRYSRELNRLPEWTTYAVAHTIEETAQYTQGRPRSEFRIVKCEVIDEPSITEAKAG